MTSILSQIANLIAHGSLPPPSWSETHTILIHKKNQDPSYISNRHLITLANTDLKLISTVLSSQIQTHASDLIHPDQAGFMKGRQIYDTILDLNALLTSPNPPPQSFILSLDWSKAYDRVSHHWLDHVLEQISFPQTFR